MEALLFVLILEVVLLQIRILEGKALRSTQELSNPRKKHQRDKLSRDRSLVRNVIRRTLIEVGENGQWYTLQEAVDIMKQSFSSILTLQIKNDCLKTNLEKIKHKLITSQYERTLALNDCDGKIALLRDQIRDSALNAKAQICFVEKWIRASAEALDMRYQTRIMPLPCQDHEHRVYNELLTAYALQIKELEDSLVYWKTRYVKDTTTLNSKAVDQRERLRGTINRRQNLQKLYDYHKGEMRAWLTFKKERAARLAREARLRTAAIRLQAWWRGVMVRRALGAFRYLRNTKKTPVKNKKK